MALIDKKSDITKFNYNKIGKTNSDENGTFKVNQSQNTGKDTGFDTESITNREYNKLRPDDGQLITKKIGERYRGTKFDGGFFRGGAALQVERTIDDVERIADEWFEEYGIDQTQFTIEVATQDVPTKIYECLALSLPMILPSYSNDWNLLTKKYKASVVNAA